MSLHENSLAAFRAGNLSVFPERTRLILRALEQLGRATDREVCARLNMPDMNAVRPRITEMVKAGVVEECGKRSDQVTGRSVRVVRIVPAVTRGAQQLELPAA